MKVVANCTIFVPTKVPDLKQGQNVAVSVEADRILKGRGRCSYHFGLTAESQKLLADLKASGVIDWADNTPHLLKKDYPALRIPVLQDGQQARLIDAKCSPAEKAQWPEPAADPRVVAAKQGGA